MATNGVIHVVKNVLYPGGEGLEPGETQAFGKYRARIHLCVCVCVCVYPADLPVGSQDLLVLLKRLIKYIQIKVCVCVCVYRYLIFSFTPSLTISSCLLVCVWI